VFPVMGLRVGGWLKSVTTPDVEVLSLEPGKLHRWYHGKTCCAMAAFTTSVGDSGRISSREIVNYQCLRISLALCYWNAWKRVKRCGP
jgi:hypothetical protein